MIKFFLFIFFSLTTVIFGLEESNHNLFKAENNKNYDYKSMQKQELLDGYLEEIDVQRFGYFKAGRLLDNNFDMLIALSPISQAKDLWIKRMALRRAGFSFFWISMLSGITTITFLATWPFTHYYLIYASLGTFISGVVSIIPMIICLSISGSLRKKAVYLYNSEIKKFTSSPNFNLSPTFEFNKELKDSFGINTSLSIKF